MEKDYAYVMEYHDDWKKKVGALGFNMKNDYLFRMLMQSDEQTLKALIASVMRVDISRIVSTVVLNPVLFGAVIDDKEMILDVRVMIEMDGDKLLKDKKYKLIDLEMQVYKYDDWKERSLAYICRAYTSIKKGDEYDRIMPVWQISFCDFPLFENSTEFISDYMLLNTRNPSQIYTDKFKITCINLKADDLATDEDLKNGLVSWAKLFKAETWEDLIMLAKNNPVMDQTISSVWQLSQDELIKEQMIRREENERFYKRIMEKAERADKAEAELVNKQAEIDALNRRIAELESVISNQKP